MKPRGHSPRYLYHSPSPRPLRRGFGGIRPSSLKLRRRIADNVRFLEERIRGACRACGRDRGEITLVAVSKGAGPEAIAAAWDAGVRNFGENRYQEARLKLDLLKSSGIRWHFLGRIQTNKLRKILDSFDFVQSMDRPEVLEKSQRILSALGRKGDVLLEVNISGEKTKAGFSFADLVRFLEGRCDRNFPALNIRGLMGIGPDTGDASVVRGAFREFRRFFDKVRINRPSFDILSMGMSRDFEIAIEEGSTMLRIGTLIFAEMGALK